MTFAKIAAASAALLLGAGPALAGPKAAPVAPLQVSYPTDGALTCDGLVAEIARMDAVMGVSAQGAQSAAGAAQAAELGASVGINAALYSGALGRVPGLGLFANGASQIAKQRAAAKQAQAQADIQTATTRRAMLNGIYQGKSCATAPAGPPATVAAASPAAAALPMTPVATTAPAAN